MSDMIEFQIPVGTEVETALRDMYFKYISGGNNPVFANFNGVNIIMFQE